MTAFAASVARQLRCAGGTALRLLAKTPCNPGEPPQFAHMLYSYRSQFDCRIGGKSVALQALAGRKGREQA